MDFASHVEATSALRRSGLRVKGVEGQQLRLLIRASRNRFTAINESGLPMLVALFEAAHASPAIANTILALASCLQATDPGHTYVYTGDASSSPDVHESTAVRNYQASLAELRSKIADFQHRDTGTHREDDAVEILGCVMMLITAGFPSVAGSASAGDWALHIAGMVSLVESLDARAIESTAIGRMAREMAAQLSIGAFSLGCTRKVGCAWLEWDMHPPEAPSEPDFSPLEVLRGYPNSFLTIMAAISGVLEQEQQAGGMVAPVARDAVQRLFNVARRRHDALEPPVAWEPASLLEMLDTALTAWEPPDIPDRLSIGVATALTNAWEVMRKAALIYLWRGGFSATVTAPLSPEHARTTTKFIREMLLILQALLSAHDENGITIMNGMTWPIIVMGNESGTSPNTQGEILNLLLEMDRRFRIPHLNHLADILRTLWQRVEQTSHAADGANVSLEAIAREIGACLPLF